MADDVVVTREMAEVLGRLSGRVRRRPVTADEYATPMPRGRELAILRARENREIKRVAKIEEQRRLQELREEAERKQRAEEMARAWCLAKQPRTTAAPEALTWDESMSISVELTSILAAVADDYYTRLWERGGE